MRSSSLLLSLSAAFTLCQCATTPTTTAPGAPAAQNLTMPGIDIGRINQLDGGSEGNISVPLLRAPDLEKRWGKPRLTVDSDGSYSLNYSNPKRGFQHLIIYGSPRQFAPAGPLPPDYLDLKFVPGASAPTTGPVSQNWQTTTLFGRTIRYCITSPDSGADVAEFTTETFTLTGPDGRTASYCLSGGSDLDSGPISIPALFKSARF
jgi:hypothetical protein